MPDFTPRLNLTKPDTGNKTWETDVENWADQQDKAAAHYLGPFHYSGVAIDEEVIIDGFFFDENVTITEVLIFAREAPTGAPLTIDFTKGGTDQGKVATLADGVKKQATTIAGLSFLKTEEFGLKIKSTGTGDAGSELEILVHYHIDALV